MGIKNLHRFLRKHTPSAYRENVSLSEYADKIVAVDINLYLYRYKSIHKDKWLPVFLNFILMLKQHRIDLVCVYDTKAPVEKNIKKEERFLYKR